MRIKVNFRFVYTNMVNSCISYKESTIPVEYHRVNTSKNALYGQYNASWH